MSDDPTTEELADLLDSANVAIGTDDHQNKISAAAQRLRYLQQTVDKLPKTADGVPVVPSMWVKPSDGSDVFPVDFMQCEDYLRGKWSVGRHPAGAHYMAGDCYKAEQPEAQVGAQSAEQQEGE